MLAVVVASVALYLPATRLRCAPVRLQLQQPNDDLKIGFSRGDDDGPKTSFAPDKRPETAPKKTVNEELMEEIQALMPPEKPAPKEAKPVDLNGIKPRDLLIGATTYFVVCYAAIQFMLGSAEYFNAHPIAETDFYFVQRLSSLARVVVVGMAALGSGVTGIAALGQLALAVQIQVGISKGELDPDAPRVLEEGRKKLELEKVFAMMTGGGKKV
mmetsp:Transcript_9870/g.24545  ORF Transcript_9870/g.24545 Transcript_9870/m.24545 type:complete len:214 (-) Transcript_9870:213-854(-)